jgi:hypothetical protein
MSRLRQLMFRALFFGNTINNMRKSMYVADSVGELNAVVG